MDQERQVDTQGRDAGSGHLEERRLALELERLRFERQKAGMELRLRRRELAAAKTRGWRDLFANPLTLAIVGGFVTLMTTTITGHFSASDNIEAEAAKARQALQTDLIKKFVDNPKPETVRANLRFLVDVGLVPNYADSLRAFLTKNPDSALPSAFTPGASGLQNVHNDDDAIDLVMQFEGGFKEDPASGVTNFGINLATMGQYLGRTATADDLRNLTAETARDVYRKLYLVSGTAFITSVQVKAAYLGLAVAMGPGHAIMLFQSAIGEADKTPVAADGVLGPQTLLRINAIDPDLLIETANCDAAKYYKSLPGFDKLGTAWIRRLRKFSPVVLKGICPELQAVDKAASAPSASP
jgi:lysozyme family protein